MLWANEAEIEKEMDESQRVYPIRRDNRRRKTDRTNPPGEYEPIARGQGLTWPAAEERLMEIARCECAGGKWMGLSSAAGVKQRHHTLGGQKVLKETVKVCRCPFFKDSGCEARVRWILDASTGLYSLERGTTWPHGDHNISTSKVQPVRHFPPSPHQTSSGGSIRGRG